MPEWDEHTRLQNEKEVLGFFVSGHPMDKYREKLRNMKVVDTATAIEMKPEPQVFRRGGNEEPQNEISDRRRHHRPEGGQVEALRRAVCAGRARRYRRQDRADRLPAELRKARREAEDRCAGGGSRRAARRRGFRAEAGDLEDQALEDVKLKLPESLRIKVPLHNPDTALLEKLHAIFLGAPGKGKLLLDLEEPGEFCAVLEPQA